MASPFEIVNEEYIEELKNKSKNENTKNNTEWLKNVFKKCFSEAAEIALVAARLGQFQQLLKIRVILILNFTRPRAITYTNLISK